MKYNCICLRAIVASNRKGKTMQIFELQVSKWTLKPGTGQQEIPNTNHSNVWSHKIRQELGHLIFVASTPTTQDDCCVRMYNCSIIAFFFSARIQLMSRFSTIIHDQFSYLEVMMKIILNIQGRLQDGLILCLLWKNVHLWNMWNFCFLRQK